MVEKISNFGRNYTQMALAKRASAQSTELPGLLRGKVRNEYIVSLSYGLQDILRRLCSKSLIVVFGISRD